MTFEIFDELLNIDTNCIETGIEDGWYTMEQLDEISDNLREIDRDKYDTELLNACLNSDMGSDYHLDTMVSKVVDGEVELWEQDLYTIGEEAFNNSYGTVGPFTDFIDFEGIGEAYLCDFGCDYYELWNGGGYVVVDY